MRPDSELDGLSHDALTVTANDHHPEPVMVSIDNTTQSLPPGTSYNLDISLPQSDFVAASVHIMGPRRLWQYGSTGRPREAAHLTVTTNATDAIGHSVRDATAFKKVYHATYYKQAGDSNLTHKIFDSNTGASARYIAVTGAQIISSTLRITFRNYFGGSATLWVKGQAVLY